MRIVHAYHRRKTAVDWHFSTKKWPDPIWILDADTRHLTHTQESSNTGDQFGNKKMLSLTIAKTTSSSSFILSRKTV